MERVHSPRRVWLSWAADGGAERTLTWGTVHGCSLHDGHVHRPPQGGEARSRNGGGVRRQRIERTLLSPSVSLLVAAFIHVLPTARAPRVAFALSPPTLPTT